MVVVVAAEVAGAGDRAVEDERLALDALSEDGLGFGWWEGLAEERLGCSEVGRHGRGGW